MWTGKRSEKARLGEDIVDVRLRRWGYLWHRPPEAEDRAHTHDRTLWKDGRIVGLAEVKTYPAMRDYPCTGINQEHFEVYRTLKERNSLPFTLYFVDEQEGWIYGGELDDLYRSRKVGSRSYPFSAWGKLFAPRAFMNNYDRLTREEREALNALSSGANARALADSAPLQKGLDLGESAAP